MKNITLILNNYASQRVAVAGLLFGINLLIAKLLGAESYASIAFFIFLVKSFLMVNLGSVSGYLFSYFNQTSDAMESESFVSIYALHLFICSLLIFCIGLVLFEELLFAAIGFILLIPIFASEPILRIRKIYAASLVPDVLLALASLFATIVVYNFLLNQVSLEFFLLLLSCIFLLIFVIFLIFLSKWPLHFRVIFKKRELFSYVQNIHRGFFMYIGTLSFILFLSVDRIFLKRFYTDHELGVYLLSYQLVVGFGLLISSMNFVSGVDIGEWIRRDGKLIDIFWSKVKAALLVAIPSFLCLILTSYFLEAFILQAYRGLTWSSTFLGIGVFAFYVSGNVTAIVFYLNRQLLLTIFLIGSVLFLVFYNFIVLQLGGAWHVISVGNAVALSVYSIFSVCFAFRLSLQGAGRV